MRFIGYLILFLAGCGGSSPKQASLLHAYGAAGVVYGGLGLVGTAGAILAAEDPEPGPLIFFGATSAAILIGGALLVAAGSRIFDSSEVTLDDAEISENQSDWTRSTITRLELMASSGQVRIFRSTDRRFDAGEIVLAVSSFLGQIDKPSIEQIQEQITKVRVVRPNSFVRFFLQKGDNFRQTSEYAELLEVTTATITEP